MPSDNLNPLYTDKLTYSVNLWTRSQLLDIFSTTKPLFYKLRQNGNIKVGKLGPQIVVPVFYPTIVGPSVTPITDSWNQLQYTETGGVTAATFTPAELGMLISASEYTADLQNSETRMVDYVESVMRMNMKKFIENMNYQIWAAAGTANAAGDQRGGLGSILAYVNGGAAATTTDGGAIPPAIPEQILDAVGTSPKTTIGGIDRTKPGAAYWCSPVLNPGSPKTLDLETINNVMSMAQNDSESTDLFIVPRKKYDYILSLLQGYTRYGNGDSALAKVGFNAVKWRTADIVFDDYCPTATPGYNMLALNTDHLFLHCKTMKPNFVRADPPDRFLMAWKGRWVGQMVIDNARCMGRHANIA